MSGVLCGFALENKCSWLLDLVCLEGRGCLVFRKSGLRRVCCSLVESSRYIRRLMVHQENFILGSLASQI